MPNAAPNLYPTPYLAELSGAFAQIRAECEYRLHWTTLESCKPSRAQRVKLEKMKKLADRAIDFINEDHPDVLKAEGINVRT